MPNVPSTLLAHVRAGDEGVDGFLCGAGCNMQVGPDQIVNILRAKTPRCDVIHVEHVACEGFYIPSDQREFR